MSMKEQTIKERQASAIKRGQSQPQRHNTQGSFKNERVAPPEKNLERVRARVEFVPTAEVKAVTARLLKEKAELWRKLSAD